MEEITQSDIELLRQFLLYMQQLPEDTYKEYKLNIRWGADTESIHKTAGAILKFMMDNQKDDDAQQISFSLASSFWRKSITIYKNHISYFLSAINIIEQYRGAELLRTGLMEKKIQEMTGFEFRTLLLSTLRDYQKDPNH